MSAAPFPVEIAVLIWLSALAASMWIPYIVGVNRHPQPGHDDFARPPDLARFPAWVHRAHRAHLNLLEQLLPFAVLVLIVDRTSVFTPLTAWTALIFLAVRLLHAAGIITGVARFPLRPILFTIGWACCLVMAYAAIAG